MADRLRVQDTSALLLRRVVVKRVNKGESMLQDMNLEGFRHFALQRCRAGGVHCTGSQKFRTRIDTSVCICLTPSPSPPRNTQHICLQPSNRERTKTQHEVYSSYRICSIWRRPRRPGSARRQQQAF